MARLIVFLSVLVGFVMIFTLSTYKKIPVSNEKFNFDKRAAVHKGSTTPKEEGAAPEAGNSQLVNGEKVYAQCISCHGKNGEGIPSMKAAHIGGQYDWYIEKQLTDMKAGTRVNETMNPTLQNLSEQDIKDVAAYVATLAWKQ